MPLAKQQQISVHTPLGDDLFHLQHLRGWEELGQPFEYELVLTSREEELPLQQLIGAPMSVHVEQPDGRLQYFHGIVAAFHETSDEGPLASHQASLRPWFWLLSRSADCRIFQNLSVPEIVQEVFRDHGMVDFELSLSGDYARREFCVQYRETAFNFVSRLLEEEGIYYFFRHESDRHVLVLADSCSAHPLIEGAEEVPYRTGEDAEKDEDQVFEWSVHHQVQPGSFMLQDFNYEKPHADLRVRSASESTTGRFEIYDYPGGYQSYDSGESVARRQTEKRGAQSESYQGAGNLIELRAGVRFALTEHPRSVFNQEYLVTSRSVELHAHQLRSGAGEPETRCHSNLTAVEVRQPFRAEQRTPEPVVQGPQTAWVVGPADQEIWTDSLGRVKVQFHWDRLGRFDEDSSCWIRVAQSWAGKRYGMQFVPRVGQEVVVEFLEGRPDRPLITGCVYNGTNAPPHELPRNATVSALRTQSSKGAQGGNELRFEDRQAEEQLFLHAQRNFDLRVKNDRFETVESNRHLVVKADKHEHVEHDRHEIVDADHRESIGKDFHLNVQGQQALSIGGSRSVTVEGECLEVFKGNHSSQVTENYFVKARGVVIEAMQGLTLKCGASSIVVDPSGVTVTGPVVTLDGGLTKVNSGPGSAPATAQAGSAVQPAAPKASEEADLSDLSEVEALKAEQRQAGSGKYGAAAEVPFKPTSDSDQPTDWLEIELLDEADQPVAGQAYRVTVADGRVIEGTLDPSGFARLEGLDPGECTVTFPDLDQECWEPL
jgi:type VI secretion system secreted protein VgrG